METKARRTKMALSAIFLAAFYLSSAAEAYIVIDPYSANGTIIQNPVFDKYFIGQLYSEGAVPVILDGEVGFYIANSTCVQKEGEKCTAVSCGEAICGSSSFHAGEGAKVIESALVTGNKEIHDIITEQNALRYEAMNSGSPFRGQYISMIENQIAGALGSELDTVYLQNRYGSSVGNLVNEEILRDPALSGIGGLLRDKDINGAAGMMDKYFAQNYNISPAYDFSDIYSAVNNRQIGPAQYAEIMSTILGQYGLNGSIGNFLNESGILNSTLGQEMMKQALEEIAKNPELMKEFEKAMSQMDTKMLNEIMSKALAEAFKNKDFLKQYLDVLSSAMNNKQVRDMFLSASADAIRQMQQSGEIDKLLDGLKDNKVKEQILSQINQSLKDSAPTFIDKMLDEIKSRVNWNYVLPIIGLIVIVIVSLRTGL